MPGHEAPGSNFRGEGTLIELQPTTLMTGLRLPEGMRWHEGRLWFSDIFQNRLYAMTPEGEGELIAEFDDHPSGVGFLEDGTAIVCLMNRRQIVRIGRDGAVDVHADLSGIPGNRINDMVVDASFRAYVNNNFVPAGGPQRPDDVEDHGDGLILVSPGEPARIVAQGGLISPNGMVITPDGRTLIMSEVRARRLTQFTISPDGSLHERATFADTDPRTPDGISLDAEGAIWLASPFTRECVRVMPGGAVTHRIANEKWCMCCKLGGSDGRTLFLSMVEAADTEEFVQRGRGAIEAVKVDVPGSEWS